jgi:hypothetical protein
VVERSAVNRLVVGSSPSSGATRFQALSRFLQNSTVSVESVFGIGFGAHRGGDFGFMRQVRVALLGDLHRAVTEVFADLFDRPLVPPRSAQQMRRRRVAHVVEPKLGDDAYAPPPPERRHVRGSRVGATPAISVALRERGLRAGVGRFMAGRPPPGWACSGTPWPRCACTRRTLPRPGRDRARR